MSIEADLNAFRDLALEEQLKIPYYLQTRGSFDCLDKELDPLLFGLVGVTGQVALSGNVYVSEYGESGYQKHLKQPATEPVVGKLAGIEVFGPETGIDHPTVQAGGFVVGYCAYVPRSSEIDDWKDYSYVFAPVDSSTLLVPQQLMDTSELLPGPDDEIAAWIDECLLGDNIDLKKLQDVFAVMETFQATEMQITHYIDYINKILPLDEFKITIVIDGVLIGFPNKNQIPGKSDAGKLWRVYDVLPSYFAYDDAAGLCIVVEEGEDENGEEQALTYPLKNIYEMDISTDRTDVAKKVTLFLPSHDDISFN